MNSSIFGPFRNVPRPALVRAILLILPLTLAGVDSAIGQDPNVLLRATDIQAPLGQEALGFTVLTGPDDEVIQGWGYGVCFDDARISVVELEFDLSDVVAEFSQFSIEPGGWTHEAIVSSLPGEGIPASSYSHYLARATYEGLVSSGSFPICPCGTLGASPVAIELATSSGNTVPTVECGMVSLYVASDSELRIEARNVDYSVDSPERHFNVDVRLGAGDSLDPGYVQALGVGVSHDSSLLSVDAVYPIGQLSYLGAGAPFSGEFLAVNLYSDGWTVNSVFGGFTQPDFSSDPEPILRAVYRSNPSLDGSRVRTDLRFSDDLGVPATTTTVVIAGQSTTPILGHGELTLVPIVGDLFRRGDCNVDSVTDIADGVTILAELFDEGPSSSCPAACEINSDGTYDLADPIYLFNSILLGGPAPADPFEECGGNIDGTGCPSYDGC